MVPAAHKFESSVKNVIKGLLWATSDIDLYNEQGNLVESWAEGSAALSGYIEQEDTGYAITYTELKKFNIELGKDNVDLAAKINSLRAEAHKKTVTKGYSPN